jgi:hypothetical protein
MEMVGPYRNDSSSSGQGSMVALVNTVMKLWGFIKCGGFLTT